MKFHIDRPLQQPIWKQKITGSLDFQSEAQISGLYNMHITAQTYPIWGCNAPKANQDKNYGHKQKYRNNLIAQGQLQ